MMLQRRRSRRPAVFGGSGASGAPACPGLALAQRRTPVWVESASSHLLAVAATGRGDDATMSIGLLNPSPIEVAEDLQGSRIRKSRNAKEMRPNFICGALYGLVAAAEVAVRRWCGGETAVGGFA
jgi:hypothetical protein